LLQNFINVRKIIKEIIGKMNVERQAKAANYLSQKYIGKVLHGQYMSFEVVNVTSHWYGIEFHIEPLPFDYKLQHALGMEWIFQVDGHTLLYDIGGRMTYLKSKLRTRNAAKKELIGKLTQLEKSYLAIQLQPTSRALDTAISVKIA
jgi:hypothetical protein